jgi:hypothetical protein
MRRESDTLRTGDRAPEFTLFDANGRAHSLSALLPGARTEERVKKSGVDAISDCLARGIVLRSAS